MSRSALAAAAGLAVVASVGCGSGGEESGDEPEETWQVSGHSQKGPFINGSTVTIQQLDNDLDPTGDTFTTETRDDLGSYQLDSPLTSPYAEVIIQGFFFNEVTGALSDASITVRAVADLAAGGPVNVNLLTHLERQRLSVLRDDGLDFDEAREQVREELLSIFGIEGEFSDFQEMDITAEGADNAVLLAVSAILTQAAIDADEDSVEAELSALLSKISADVEEDGELDSDSVNERLVRAARHLDLAATREALEERLEDLEADGVVPPFEDYVDSDGDGLLNVDDDDVPNAFEFEPVVNAYLATEYETNEVTPAGLSDEGFTRARVEGATLVVNGTELSEETTELYDGDVISLKLTSSDEFSTEVVARLAVGDVVEMFSVETGSEEDYGDDDGDDVVNIEDDDAPDAFSFASVTEAERLQVFTEAVTISGLSTAGSTRLDLEENSAELRVEYPPELSCTHCADVPQPAARLLKNGSEVSLPSTVENGAELELELVAPYAYGASMKAWLTVGDRTEEFSVTSREHGALMAEGTLEEPWPLYGDLYFDGYYGSVDTGASYYTVVLSGGSFDVAIEDMTDDVDLYIYGEDDFSSKLVCSSTSSGTTWEGCYPVSIGNSPVYVIVDGSKTQAGATFLLRFSP